MSRELRAESREPKALAVIIGLIALPLLVGMSEAVVFKVTNRDDHSLTVDGRRREYTLYIPPSYDRSKPTPLVISIHGAGLWGQAQRRISLWDRLADREGFIVAYPSAIRGRGPMVWHEGGMGPTPDTRFIGALIDTLASQYNVDPARIYANGLSNGGGMTWGLSCKLPHRIAAFGLVGAALTMDMHACADSIPTPVIIIHGTGDNAAHYQGGDSWVSPGNQPWPSVPAFTANWARRNHCAQREADVTVVTRVQRRAYSGCAAAADVVLYTIEGGGHTWPGGTAVPEAFFGPTERGFDADSAMWQFYLAHPLKR